MQMSVRQFTRVAERISKKFDKHESPSLRAFGLGAAPAVVGILGVTALSLSRDALVAWPYILIAATALVVSTFTRIHPIALLAAGGLAGWIAN
jgi:chromate transport protein ChrA